MKNLLSNQTVRTSGHVLIQPFLEVSRMNDQNCKKLQLCIFMIKTSIPNNFEYIY
jgi:hypothetical protein